MEFFFLFRKINIFDIWLFLVTMKSLEYFQNFKTERRATLYVHNMSFDWLSVLLTIYYRT